MSQDAKDLASTPLGGEIIGSLFLLRINHLA